MSGTPVTRVFHRVSPALLIRSLRRPSASRFSPLVLVSSHRIPPARRNFSLAPIYETTQAAILGLHAVTGLPWIATIPLIAVSVNLLFRLPFTIYTQYVIRRRTMAMPVLQAWQSRLMRDVSREPVSQSVMVSRVGRRFREVQRRVFRKVGAQQWKMFTQLSAFPFWIAGIDGIRRLCGGRRGWLGGLLFGKDDVLPTAGIMTDGGAIAGGVPPGPTAVTSASDTLPTDAADVPWAETMGLVNRQSATFEPSLTTEGGLWFPDLTLADPYSILPFALSAMLLINLTTGNGNTSQLLFGTRTDPTASTPSSTADAPTVQPQKNAVGKALLRAAVLFSLAVGPLTMDMPCALHLYWLSSAFMQWSTRSIVHWVMMIKDQKQSIQRCKGSNSMIVRPKRGEATIVR